MSNRAIDDNKVDWGRGAGVWGKERWGDILGR